MIVVVYVVYICMIVYVYVHMHMYMCNMCMYSCVCICQQSAEDLAGVPSVYELNAAFEAVKLLVVKT